MSGDSAESRDALIAAGMVNLLTSLLAQPSLQSGVLKYVCWIASNLCKGSPPASIEAVLCGD